MSARLSAVFVLTTHFIGSSNARVTQQVHHRDSTRASSGSPGPRVQLAFGVMTFQRNEDAYNDTVSDFMRLMGWLYEDERNHVYVLHTDSKCDREVHSAITDVYCGSRSNCMALEPRSVTWGGISVVEMNLALMHAADDFMYPNGSASSWQYFALVGHESVPLMKLSYMESFLASYPPGTNFINCWDSDGYDFFGQHEDILHRQAAVVIDGFDENTLYEGFDIERKLPHDLKLYKTIQYVVLSRDFVRYVCKGPDTRRVLMYLANVKASDELVLPTLLQRSPQFAATATCDTTLHFTHWIR